ncbi:MAG: DUF1735 domain-containing protein [Bacteroidales bacterium]|nr:DUF1735 domain-containing protein [Bacteroidales bacterium]
MKKFFIFTCICGLALLAGACKDNKDVDDTRPAITTSVKNVDQTRILEAVEQTIRIEVVIAVQSGTVTEALTPVLKVDDAAVDKYNAAHAGANATLLPASAYNLEERGFAIARGGKESAVELTIGATGLEVGALYVLPVAIDKMEGSTNWKLAENSTSFITVKLEPTTQDGSKENPYLLYTVQNMESMYGKMKEGATVYFKMMEDIDMKDVEWMPLNYAGPYEKAIDFDGNGHTISNFYCDYANYPSFFGVLNGYCHDVTFVNAKVEAVTDQRIGILAGYCGTGDIRGVVARVHVQGETDHTPAGNSKYGAGGFFGYLSNGAIYASSADVVVKSKKNNVGGLFGYCGPNAQVVDCWTSGTIIGNQRVGGIGGGTDGKDADIPDLVKVINCYSTATVKSSRSLGGIFGFLNHASTTAGDPLTSTPKNHVENCIAWNESIVSNYDFSTELGTIATGTVNQYSNGAVVGYTSVNNYLIGCLRNPAMKYNENIFFDYTDMFSLYDQDDASPTSPLAPQTSTAATEAGSQHNFPYHGKAAAAGKTVSQLAQELGWSADVWDFSKELPTIKPDAKVEL